MRPEWEKDEEWLEEVGGWLKLFAGGLLLLILGSLALGFVVGVMGS